MQIQNPPMPAMAIGNTRTLVEFGQFELNDLHVIKESKLSHCSNSYNRKQLPDIIFQLRMKGKCKYFVI